VGSLRLIDVRGVEVEVGGRRHVVDVLGGGAEQRSRSGRTFDGFARYTEPATS
jgi:hypothetical protein